MAINIKDTRHAGNPARTRRWDEDEDEEEGGAGVYGMRTDEDEMDDEDEDDDGPGLRVKCPECETEMEVRMPKGMKLVDSESGEAVRRGRKKAKAGEAARVFHRGFREAMKNA